MSASRVFTMALIVLCLITLSLPGTAQDDAKAEIGERAPDFTLPDESGNDHALGAYEKQVVVLEWVNFGCPFVKKFYESGVMQKYQKTYTDKKVVWITICSSAEGKQGYLTRDEINEAIKEKGMHCSTYLQDVDGTVGRLYGAKTTPQMCIIDMKGNLVFNGGIDGTRSADPKDIETADQHFINALEAVLHGGKVENPSPKPYGCSVKYK